MDCCNYSEYRMGVRPAPPPSPYCAPYGRYGSGVPPPPSPYTSLYGDVYGSHLTNYQLVGQQQQQQLPHHHQHRPYDAYHQMQQRHHDYSMMHAQPPIQTDYLYGGKQPRSRRSMRDRERERPRQPYHSDRWSNGQEYEEMQQYIPECETSHPSWNYYQQGSTWTNEMSRMMPQPYGMPSMVAQQVPPSQQQMPQQPYQQDPLRGLAAMQANTPTPMNDKMSGMNNMRMGSVQAAPPSCCCSYSGGCSCNARTVASPRPEVLPRHNELGMHPLQQQQQHLMASKQRAEHKSNSIDRSRRNKSPKSKSEDPPTSNSDDSSPAVKTEPVPLPAFQQAFGSTEIGRFSGAFIRADVDFIGGDKSITEEMVRDAIWNQLGDGLGDEWREQPLVQLDACFEPLPPGPAPAWNPAPAPTHAHHIY